MACLQFDFHLRTKGVRYGGFEHFLVFFVVVVVKTSQNLINL